MLRKLEAKDAPYMLEWMKDKSIVSNFKTRFSDYSLDKVVDFINCSFEELNQHFAIVDEYDTYLGTISLKDISWENRNAEYAIVLRKEAHNKGVGTCASKEILYYAFETLDLEKVYLNVLAENVAAISMYEKLGFRREGIFFRHYKIQNMYHDLWWYAIFKEDFIESRVKI